MYKVEGIDLPSWIINIRTCLNTMPLLIIAKLKYECLIFNRGTFFICFFFGKCQCCPFCITFPLFGTKISINK